MGIILRHRTQQWNWYPFCKQLVTAVRWAVFMNKGTFLYTSYSREACRPEWFMSIELLGAALNMD
jgi:hypothetical protein